MKTKMSLLLAGILLLCIVLSGCGQLAAPSAPAAPDGAESGAPADNGQTYTMKIATATAQGNPQTTSLEWLKEYIETESNGRIVVETYPAGQMGSAVQQHQLLLANEIQGIAEPTAFMVGFCDELTLLDLPYMMDFDRITLQDISDVFNSDATDPIRMACEAKGLYMAGINVMTYRMLMTNFPVAQLADLSGKKIRCGNTLLQEEWGRLGATGIVLSVPELYTALQQGTVDGHESDYNFFDSGKYYEVASYLVDTPLGTQNSVHLFNLEWIESLPQDLQEVVKGASAAIREKYENACWEAQDRIRSEWTGKGITFCEVSDDVVAEMKDRLSDMSEWYLEKTPSMSDCYQNIITACEASYQ